jgi:hypothetical protein
MINGYVYQGLNVQPIYTISLTLIKFSNYILSYLWLDTSLAHWSYPFIQQWFRLGVDCFAILSMCGMFTEHAWGLGVGLNKNLLYQFIEGQIHFDMPRGAKMGLAPNESIQTVLLQTSTPTPTIH